jgi:plastocyanin
MVTPVVPEPSVEDTGAGNAASPEVVDPTQLGRIRGVVHFDGTPPPRQVIEMSAVAGCSEHDTPQYTERIVVTDQKLANVFVYVTRGLEKYEAGAAPSEPLVIHQTGCVFAPHVAAARTGQRVLVENRDGITHNVNLKSQRNSDQTKNQGQAAGSPAMEFRFAAPEVAVTVACDYHPWMKAYLCVLEHPFFAVTGTDGGFEIAGLAPGKYTLSAWHEAFKIQREELVVPAGGEAVVEFHFKD